MRFDLVNTAEKETTIDEEIVERYSNMTEVSLERTHNSPLQKLHCFSQIFLRSFCRFLTLTGVFTNILKLLSLRDIAD